MQTFLNDLRRTLNHLSHVGHSALHKEIKAAADRHFSGIKDDQIEDWLYTEDMHFRGFPHDNKPKEGEEFMFLSNEDLRADTDRTMFGVLDYLLCHPKYKNKLSAFKKDLSPKLKEHQLTPSFTIQNLDKMPFDAAHVFHTVMSHQFSVMRDPLKKYKILPEKDIDNYIKAVRQMNSDYYTFGGELFQKSLNECNNQMTRNCGLLASLSLDAAKPNLPIITYNGHSCTRN